MGGGPGLQSSKLRPLVPSDPLDNPRIPARAAWVVVGRPTAETPVELFNAIPSTWTVTRSCGCVLPIPLAPGRRVTTLAVPCRHYVPGRIGQALGDRERRRQAEGAA